MLGGLLTAAAIAGLVAVYQGFVDLGFLNEGFWEYMIRASGTLADANKLGAVAAFWAVGALAYARGSSSRWSAPIGVAGLGLGVTAAWLSGSRTGLAAVLISVTIARFEALRSLKLDLRKVVMAGGGALVVGAVLVVVLQSASTHTIVQRGTLGYLPFFGDRGIADSANELLWDRFGYGPSAMQMVKEHPIDGVGLVLIMSCRTTTAGSSGGSFQRRTTRRPGGGTTLRSLACSAASRSWCGSSCSAGRCSPDRGPATDGYSACYEGC